ncbi:MAG: hypothetical protein ACKVS9_04565 [Phycisphaerae bacterium]
MRGLSGQIRTTVGFITATVLGATLIPSGGSALAQDKPEGGERPRQARQEGEGREGGREGRRAEGPSVEGAMKGMNRAARALKDSIGDAAKNDENLKLVSDLQRACVGAKGMPVPAEVLSKAADDAARTKMSSDYRRGLLAAARLLLDLEEALLDGKNDIAAKKFDEFQKARDAGHAAMGFKDE